MTQLHRLAAGALLLAAGACAGGVYLPGQPGSPNTDISGVAEREEYLQENPDTPGEITTAIMEGVFAEGMTIEHRDVVTNPDRRGVTGSGFWRSRELAGETRYQWFVANEREPFDDGRGRPVCELVFVDDLLAEVRFCSGADSLETDEGG